MAFIVRANDGKIAWGLTLQQVLQHFRLWQLTGIHPFRISAINREWKKRADRYGHAIIKSADAYRVFEEETKMIEKGFTRIKPGLFGRAINAEITQLIKVQFQKGSYLIVWGLSFSFVPHKFTPQLSFHGDLKSSRLDMAMRLDYADLGKIAGAHPALDGFHGIDCFKDDLERIWPQAWSVVTNWFDRIDTLERALTELRSTTHDALYMEQVVIAYLMAKLGDAENAKQYLRSYFSSHRCFKPAEEKNILAGLDQS